PTPPPRVSPLRPAMLGAHDKPTPANSAAVLIKSLFLIRTVPLVVPARRTLVRVNGSGKTKEPLRRFRLQREQIQGTCEQLPTVRPSDSVRRCCAAIWWLRQKSGEISRPLHHLFHGALSRGLVGAPPQEFGSMAKAVASKVVIANFNHELGL